jgi:hypothetical protein
VVGFWRADHEEHIIGLGSQAYAVVEAVSSLDRLGHKARRRLCPLYVTGLIGSGDRKSVQPMAARLAPGDYDQLHHFVAAGVWDAAPLESELLVQADKLVGGQRRRWTTAAIRDKASNICRTTKPGLSANIAPQARRNTTLPICPLRPICAPWRPLSRLDGFASKPISS